MFLYTTLKNLFAAAYIAILSKFYTIINFLGA